MSYQPKEWQVQVGERGYSFVTFSRKDAVSCKDGVYIFGYTHLRGHLAGYQLNVLGIVEAARYQDALDKVLVVRDLEKVHWNSVYFYEFSMLSSERKRFMDAMKSLPLTLYSS